jgi:phage-related protein
MQIVDGILQDLGWHCRHHIPSPRPRLHAEQVPNRPGEYVFGAEYEPRVITLILTTDTRDKSAVKKELEEFLTSETELVIDDLTYAVKYSMMDVFSLAYAIQATVTLKMTNPFAYSEEHTQTGSGTCINSGNIETCPIIEIPSSVNPSVTVNGITLSYTGVVSGLVIDCEKQTVMDGSTNVIQNFNGVFPVFKVGSNTVTGNAVFKWRDRYI